MTRSSPERATERRRPPPKGFDFGTFEHSLSKKSDIVQSLKDSFAHLNGALRAMPDADMDKPAEFFGMKTTTRGTFLLLLSHAHEHLGQAIAYARSLAWAAPSASPPSPSTTSP